MIQWTIPNGDAVFTTASEVYSSSVSNSNSESGSYSASDTLIGDTSTTQSYFSSSSASFSSAAGATKTTNKTAFFRTFTSSSQVSNSASGGSTTIYAGSTFNDTITDGGTGTYSTSNSTSYTESGTFFVETASLRTSTVSTYDWTNFYAALTSATEYPESLYEIYGDSTPLPTLTRAITLTTRSSSISASSTTTTYLTTTLGEKTWWYFEAVETHSSRTTVTTLSETHEVGGVATIIQCESNEVIYYITNPPTLALSPQAGRPLAQTTTRITVSTSAGTTSQEMTNFSHRSLSSSTISTQTQFTTEKFSTKAITLYDVIDGSFQSTTEEWNLFEGTEVGEMTTTTISVNYTVDESTSESGDSSANALAYGVTYSANQIAYHATQLPTLNMPISVDNELDSFYTPQTSALRYANPKWSIDESTAKWMSASFQISSDSSRVPWLYTASHSRGVLTLIDTTLSTLTLIGHTHTTSIAAMSGSVQTTSSVSRPAGFTYQTTMPSNSEGISTTTRTASIITTSFAGGATRYGDFFYSTGDAASDYGVGPDHFGGGSFAENFSVVNRVVPQVLYQNVMNSSTKTFNANDTTYSSGQKSDISNLSVAPFLLGGGGFAGSVVQNLIYWTEKRNPTDLPSL